MKIYKTYFEKTDTPFKKEYQPKRKFDTAWYHLAYTSVLQHPVAKIKLFGIITIYRKEPDCCKKA